MTLRIDDPESERLILELSALTGETPEHVLLSALSERLQRERLKKLVNDANRLVVDEFASFLIADERSGNEILGYDENGLPS
jgi:antitoxin VapB